MPRKNKILIRTGSVAPAAGDFVTSEPAWDSSAGKFYIKDAAGTMVHVGGFVEAATPLSFPATGTTGLLYLAGDSNRLYRWVDASTKYVEVGPVGSGGGSDSTLWSLFLPPAPTSVTGTSGDSQVVLSWTAPAVSAQTPITSYTIQWSINGGTNWYSYTPTGTSATSATLTGLTNGTAYIFRVLATNAVGSGPYSAASASVTPGGDPLFSQVALLLHLDGANGSTTITDSSGTPKTITVSGGAAISTAQSKFGGASGAFNGSTDYLTVADSNMAVGSGNFTLECWLYMVSFGTGIRTFWAHRANENDVGGALLTQTGGSLRLYIAGNTATWQVVDFSPGLTLSLNTWQHVALVRDGNTIRTFLNGSPGTTTTVSSGLIYTASNFSLMAGTAAGTQNINGYIDEFRFTKGSARYTSTFTPPSAPFPNF